MNFQDFITSLLKKSPAGIAFNIKPNEKWQQKETVSGFKLNKFDSLTLAETWFFDTLNTLNVTHSSEISLQSQLLAAELKKVFPKIKYLSEAISLTFTSDRYLKELEDEVDRLSNLVESAPVEELKTKYIEELEASEGKYKSYKQIVNSPEYGDFFLKNTKTYQHLTELTQLIQDTTSMTWLKVTFFMMSRYDGSWAYDDTASLPMTVIDKLNAFMVSEMGVATETQLEVVEDASPKEEDNLVKLSAS